MEPIDRLEATAAAMARANVDTDQIIPARFLQKPREPSLGEYLFRDLRFAADGSEIPDFFLNQPPNRAARVLVADTNFGCGSSRENAVWALHDYGFRAVIAPSFGDIFATNSLKNGLLPIRLPAEVVTALLARLGEEPGLPIAVDLAAQTVTLPDGATYAFDIDPFAKHCLLNGFDELEYTLTRVAEIAAFERRYGREND
jgi:3-isopropylmalate/(R)-2-methylmalate dehydratase small subunit